MSKQFNKTDIEQLEGLLNLKKKVELRSINFVKCQKHPKENELVLFF